MKMNYAIVLMGTLAFCLSTQSQATEHHSTQALEHSVMATEKEQAEAHVHMTANMH